MTKPFLFLLAGLSLLPVTGHGDWVDNFFGKTQTAHGASSFQSQQRGFYSAGGFSGRHRSSTDYLMTVSLPKVKTGCGGVDAFYGGMTFLNSDYLVEKFNNMVQMLPAMAFDMALKEVSKELSESMGKLTAITDYLNNIQMNECAMAKRLVTTVRQGNPDILGEMWGEMTGDQQLNLKSKHDNWYSVGMNIKENDNNPTQDLRPRTSGCPKLVRDVFKGGSVIAHATEQVGLSEYAGIMRGYVGDVIIKDGLIPTARSEAPCKENNEASLEDMLEGQTWSMDEQGQCTKTQKGKSLYTLIHQRLTGMGEVLKNNKPLTAVQQSFVDATPGIPVYAILRKAVVKDTLNLEIAQMTDNVGAAPTPGCCSTIYTAIPSSCLPRSTVRWNNPVFRAVRRKMTRKKTQPLRPRPAATTGSTPPPLTTFTSCTIACGRNRRHLRGTYHLALVRQLNTLQYQAVHQDEDVQVRHNKATPYNRQ